jgi:hypothetical protein
VVPKPESEPIFWLCQEERLHHEHGPRGFSFELEEAPARGQDLGRLDLDWSDLGQAAPKQPPAESPTNPMAAGTPLMPHAAAARTAAPARPLLTAFAPPDAAAAVSSPVQGPTASPAVRRLRFPTATAPQLKPSPRPSTRFADSVGRSRPSADSASELPSDESTPPEDLPLRGSGELGASPPASPRAADPALLLRRAGTLFASAKETALDLSGRGLESGRVLAHQMSDALRERLERKAENPPTIESRDSVVAGPTSPVGVHAARGDMQQVTSAAKLLTIGRHGAGPLLALVAALGMFLGSRHILGSGAPLLSKTAPAVPNLGELDGADRASRTSQPGPNAEAAGKSEQPAGPPAAMATEVVPLPPGMAWPGKGLLEVVTSEDELVYVDGVFTGRGPLRRVPVTPGEHEVSIRKDGSVRQGNAKVEPNRTTRAIFRGR